MIVELWESLPRIIEKKNEDGTTLKEVLLNENTNKPIIDKRVRGILKVSLSDWLMNRELKVEDQSNHFKMFFFDKSY